MRMRRRRSITAATLAAAAPLRRAQRRLQLEVARRRPRARPRAYVTGLERLPAAGADAPVVHLAAAVAMLHHHGRPVRVHVAVAPLHQRDEHRPEVEALLGEAVLVARRPLLVEPSLEDP